MREARGLEERGGLLAAAVQPCAGEPAAARAHLLAALAACGALPMLAAWLEEAAAGGQWAFALQVCGGR